MQRVAEVGSVAGAFAVAPDGALLLGDGRSIWRVPHPRAAGRKIEDEEPGARGVERIAESLGDVYGIALGGGGVIYASDWAGGRILAIDRDRRVRVLAEGLSYPSGLVIDGEGRLVVKESGRQDGARPRLLRLGPEGKVVPWVELVRGDTR